MVGGLERKFSFFGGGVCRGVAFWSGSGGGGDFSEVGRGTSKRG